MAKAHRTYDEATVEMFRRDPDLTAGYLNSVQNHDGDLTPNRFGAGPSAQELQ